MPSQPRKAHSPSSTSGDQVTLSLLDGFELRRNGDEIDLPLSAQRLVAFLALHDRSMTRMYIAACLWLEASEERGRANLRSALWRVNQPGQSVVEASATHLRLNREVFVDVASLISTARRLLREPGRDSGDSDLDEQWLLGELLPDWYDDWVLEQRDRLHELRLHALEVLSARLAKEGRFGEAVEAALAAVHAEPLRESAQRALINVFLAEGNYSVALRQYRAYRARLHDELGLEPSARMDEVLRDLAVEKVDAQRGAGAGPAPHRRR